MNDILQTSHILIFGLLAYLLKSNDSVSKANRCAAILLVCSALFYSAMGSETINWLGLKPYPNFFWGFMIKIIVGGYVLLRLLNLNTNFSNIIAFLIWSMLILNIAAAFEYPFYKPYLENIYPSCNTDNKCYGLIKPIYGNIINTINSLICIIGGVNLSYVIIRLFYNSRAYNTLVGDQRSNFITFINIFSPFNKGLQK